MSKTHCPNCDAVIKVEKPRRNKIITCSSCGVELEIVNVDPLTVDFTDDWQDE